MAEEDTNLYLTCFYFFKLCLIAWLFIYILIKVLSNNQSFCGRCMLAQQKTSKKKKKGASFFSATLTFGFPNLTDSLGNHILMSTEKKWWGIGKKKRASRRCIKFYEDMSITLACFRGKWKIMTPFLANIFLLCNMETNKHIDNQYANLMCLHFVTFASCYYF